MARLNEFYGKPERRSRLAFQVTEEKVVNYLMSKAKVTEVPKINCRRNQTLTSLSLGSAGLF